MPVFPARVLVVLSGVAILGTSACTQTRTHQGYVVDRELVDAIQPGVDNRDSVMRTLGRPTLTGQFSEGEWYYVSRDSRNFQFNNPHAKSQLTMRVRFDKAGNVTAVDRIRGIDQIASIHPYGKTTPTLGRHRSFFQDLFGNIGTVGAAGAGAPNNDNTGGP